MGDGDLFDVYDQIVGKRFSSIVCLANRFISTGMLVYGHRTYIHVISITTPKDDMVSLGQTETLARVAIVEEELAIQPVSRIVDLKQSTVRNPRQ